MLLGFDGAAQVRFGFEARDFGGRFAVFFALPRDFGVALGEFGEGFGFEALEVGPQRGVRGLFGFKPRFVDAREQVAQGDPLLFAVAPHERRQFAVLPPRLDLRERVRPGGLALVMEMVGAFVHGLKGAAAGTCSRRLRSALMQPC